MPEPIVETEVYRLTRAEMARLASVAFLRTFWWAAVGMPLGGIVFLIVGRGGPLEIIGVAALLWPFSIPARAVISSSKPARLFCGGVKAILREDGVEFQGQTPGKSGKRLRMLLPRENIRDVVESGRFLQIRSMHYGIVSVPKSAFLSTEDEARFRALE